MVLGFQGSRHMLNGIGCKVYGKRNGVDFNSKMFLIFTLYLTHFTFYHFI